MQDFVVVPLDSSTIHAIFSKLGGTIPRSVLHIQIEKNGQREFGAYDSFHPDCIFLGGALTEKFVYLLVSAGLLTPILR